MMRNSVIAKTAASASILRVMSFNLADANDAPQWPVDADRKKHVLDLVQQHKPHVLCLQESMFLPSEFEHLGLFAPKTLKPTTTHAGDCQIFTSLPIVSEAQTEPDQYSNTYAFQLLEVDVSSILGTGEGPEPRQYDTAKEFMATFDEQQSSPLSRKSGSVQGGDLDLSASNPRTIVKTTTAVNDAMDARSSNDRFPTMVFSSVHLAPMAHNVTNRAKQVDRIIYTAFGQMMKAHSLVVVGDSNMRRDEACDAMGLKDGYLSFKQHQQRTAPMRSPLLTSPNVEDTTTDPAAATHIVVDGNVVALDSLLDNAGLRKHLSADGPSTTLPRFCRIKRRRGGGEFRHAIRGASNEHDRLSCLDLHLKDEDAEPPEPSMVLSHLYPEDEFTWDSIRDKFNGLEAPGYRTRYDRIFIAKELLDESSGTESSAMEAEDDPVKVLLSPDAGTPRAQRQRTERVEEGWMTPPKSANRRGVNFDCTPERQSCKKIQNHHGRTPTPPQACPSFEMTELDSGPTPLKVDVVGWQLIGDEPYPAPDCEPGLLDMASATMDLDATEDDLRKLYYLSDHFGFVADLQLSLRADLEETE